MTGRLPGQLQFLLSSGPSMINGIVIIEVNYKDIQYSLLM